ncbi:MAG: hypothetical protein JWM38_486 [Sphingomonas bacterium]|nr:hypothetical protein [Sphingomonas bacterium]MDB5717059.1 hypothetical protein [Sphingomonas bacterium]
MGDAFDPAGFMETALRTGHSPLIGARYLGHGADWAELAMDHSPAIGDESGGVAFGPLATLLDMAAGTSVWVRLGRFSAHATLDLRIDLLRAATPGRTIVAHGQCHGLAGAAAFVRGHAHDGDPADPIALVAGTFMAIDRW